MSSTTGHHPASFVVGVELGGAGAHPGAAPRSGPTVQAATAEASSAKKLRELVQGAEIAGFHLATFRDSRFSAVEQPALDPVQRAAFAAPLTTSIGLVPQVGTLYTEPFHLATQLASLDYSSRGRAGWLVSAEHHPAEADSVGRSPLAEEERGAEAAEVVEVNRRLWDSWEDDAVIREVSTGRYLDRNKLHYADFEGSRFSIKGPSIIPRPLQGQVLVIAPAELVPRLEADVALVSADRIESLGPAAAGVTGAPRTLLELQLVLDSRGQSAAERLAELESRSAWTPAARYVGDAAGLVELLGELAGQADGVRLHPAELNRDLAELSALVLPELRRRSVTTAPLAGATLRQTFRLPKPSNRYAATAAG